MRYIRTTAETTLFVLCSLLAFALLAHPGSAKLLDPAEQGFGGQSRDQNYDALLDAMYANGKTVSTIGDKMWVPWFRTSSSCSAADLHSGNTCN